MRSIAGRIERAGPFVMVTASPSRKHVELLQKAGRPVPAPRTIRALVDTGAMDSVLDLNIIAHLGLIPTGRVKIHTPSTSGSEYEERDQYGVRFFLGSQPEETAEFTISVIGSALASEGFFALVGWNILDKCVLLCDGPKKTFQLDY